MLRRASTLPCLRQGRAASPRSASSLQRHRRLRPRRQFCRRIIFGSAKIEAIRASSQRCRSMTIVCARTPRDVGTEPELRTAGAAVQTRIVSVAGIRLDPNRSMRCFKGIVYVDIFSSPTCPATQSVSRKCAARQSSCTECSVTGFGQRHTPPNPSTNDPDLHRLGMGREPRGRN